MVNILKARTSKSQKNYEKVYLGFPLLTFGMAFIFTLGMTNAYAESVLVELKPGVLTFYFVIFLWRRRKKIKIYYLMTIRTDRRKIVAGENYLYWVHDFVFSNVIVFAGTTLGGFLL